MSPLPLTLLLLAIGIPASLLAWARRKELDLKQARAYRERYFQLAETLADDKRTPESLWKVVTAFGKAMESPGAPLILGMAMLVDSPKSSHETFFTRAMQESESLPENLRFAFFGCMFSAVCSLTYESVIVGPLVRRRLGLKGKRNGEKTERYAPSVVERVSHASLLSKQLCRNAA